MENHPRDPDSTSETAPATANQILKVDDDTLAIITPDKREWRLVVANLQAHPDFVHLHDLEIVEFFEGAHPDILAQYGVQSSSAENPPSQ